ncbi:MAG: hypothetical protein ACQEQL_00425 [Pseudomonadota bacterium]
MTSSDNSIEKLGSYLDGSHNPDLPDLDKMVEFGLDVLTNSSIGTELVMFVREHDVKIRIIRGPEETSYAADPHQAVISLNSANPAGPARFVLLLTGAIRDVMQLHEGLPTPGPSENMSKAVEKMRQKQGDKVSYMCAVAYEINEISSFSAYTLVEELRNMGYAEDVERFLQHV